MVIYQLWLLDRLNAVAVWRRLRGEMRKMLIPRRLRQHYARKQCMFAIEIPLIIAPMIPTNP